MRTTRFERNIELEKLLREINKDLWLTEKELLSEHELNFPVIFIVGPLRSGTTLFLQWLANTGCFSYPTNFLSRFYNAPIIGSKLQLMLTDERYNFRNELKDLIREIDYSSENGKTKGLLSPNEFWYFWRRFLHHKEIDYISTDVLLNTVDTQMLLSEFAGIVKVFNKPFALKALILNYNIDFLDKIFKKAIFVYTKRDPITNVLSVLQARKRQLGSEKEWYSFKIPEYSFLKEIKDPVEQVTGQIYYINKAIKNGLENIPDNKKLTIDYEEFCNNPERYYYILLEKIKKHGITIEEKYKGPKRFTISRVAEKEIGQKIKDIYNNFK